MNTFLLKTISKEKTVPDEDGSPVTIKAFRTRTSAGGGWITIDYGGQKIDFQGRDICAVHARALADMLISICDNDCELSET